ncbi:DUF4838 domain-containing protein [Flavobacterium sp. MK4S-17]|uniref:DUF4838 domain-containing protein n=1 Tax=Flavobacterium sp. MK4S-17 TaxID=2543737 RepID=UPI0013591CB4|nr:DUF4838 domain-containing protein [Flavobacterium sp. MK4S-17]
MLNKLTIYIFIFFCTGCSGASKDVIFYQKGKIAPVIVVEDMGAASVAVDFRDLFEKATGARLQILNKIGTEKHYIKIGFSKDNKGYFNIKWDNDALHITAAGKESLYYGCRHFLSEYAGISQFNVYRNNSLTDTIKFPQDLDYTFIPDFEYREPFFTDNYNAEFRKWNKTNTLDEHWGLWGHNIAKVIKPTAEMMAEINGEKNEEQFCFSSPELEKAIINHINRQEQDNPGHDKFMIMPNDNAIVCQCSKCIAKGNTKTNASPAVFSLLNKLSVKFPYKQFFSTAYITTQHPPAFKLADNAGVMISTMDFPKGVVISKSNKKEKIAAIFSDWKKVTDKIYIWDYAVNFDNYFQSYPTLSITQENLKFYKNAGAKGVFMHGREDAYCAFGDLKCYVYAQLLSNVGIDIDTAVAYYFKQQYPEFSEILTDYYLKIDHLSLESNKVLDIYGGLKQAKKKYLNTDEFNTFYSNIIQRADNNEYRELNPLLLALTFQKLELMRTNSIGKNGYANFDSATATAKLNTEVEELLERLTKLQKSTGIESFKEAGFSINDYIGLWRDEIVKPGYKNLLYGKNFTLLSAQDEDYTDMNMLNDGAIGFHDYYNNWVLNTVDAFSVKINASDIAGAHELEMNFLSDVRHNIYLPQKLEVTVDGKKYETVLAFDNNRDRIYKHKAVMPLQVNTDSREVIIKVIKQNDFKSKSIACDEIIFK